VPGIAVPDLQVVANSRDDDLTAELRVLQQRRRNHHAALFVEVGLGRSREEKALDPARFLAERIQRGDSRLDESKPILTTVGMEAPVEPARDDHALLKGLTELGGKGEAVLVIDRVLVCAEEHLGPVSLYHCSPLCPTLTHLSRPSLGEHAGITHAVQRLLLLAAVLALAGCGSSSAQHDEWNRPQAKPDGTLPVSAFNEFLADEGKDFARSPIEAVTKFVRLDNTSAAVTTVRATSPGEVRNFSEVVVTLDGLLDDSVRAARYTIELQRDAGGMWRLRTADWAEQCQPGRGHQDFSARLCS
jgi:hypothetical protein